MTTIDIVKIISIFFAIIIVCFIAKKLYYRFVLKKKLYLIPKTTTKGITSVGITLSISITIVILLIFVTADLAAVVFRLWSGTRIIIEGIMIKIGGLLFGPIVGMFLGASIDFLTVSLTAGVFNIGYFITAILFGLISGIIHTIIATKNKSDFWTTFWSSILFVILIGLAIGLIYSVENDGYTKYTITFMSLSFKLSIEQIIYIITGLGCLSLLVLWIVYGVNWYQKKYKNQKSYWYQFFAPVFTLIIITELLCNILIMPTFDAMLSPLNYVTWFAIRLLLYIPMVILNLLIIFPVYQLIKPIIKYNYLSECIDDIHPKKLKKSERLKNKYKKCEV